MPDASSQFTRLVQALKGTSRFTSPKARVVISNATTRDQLILTALPSAGSVREQAAGANSANGVFSLTGPGGSKYALLDISGFADGSLLYD